MSLKEQKTWMNQICEDYCPDHTMEWLDDLDDALVGVGIKYKKPIAVYDRNDCIHLLMVQKQLTEEEAEEYFDFHISGAYRGEDTPIFLIARVDR